MKHFLFLFSLYLILLGLMPCQDERDMMVESQTETLVHVDHSESDHLHGETCPPFCSCACCSVGQYFLAENLTEPIAPSYQKPYPYFQCSALKKQPVDVWQPPKLI